MMVHSLITWQKNTEQKLQIKAQMSIHNFIDWLHRISKTGQRAISNILPFLLIGLLLTTVNYAIH